MFNNLTKYLNKEADFRNYLLGFRCIKLIVSILIFIKCFTYFFNPNLLATPSGISLYNGFLEAVYTVSYFPQMVIIFTVILTFLSLFGKGNVWTGFLLFVGVYIIENICFLCNHGMDNHLKMMTLFLIPLTNVSIFESRILKITTWQKLGFLSIKFHLCLVYIASVTGKLIDETWLLGMANTYILSMERFAYFPSLNDWIANSFFLTKFTSYFTLLFELCFPIFIWYKRTQKWMIILGVIFHIVLLLLFMLVQFELLYIAMILCFVNTNSNNRIYSK